MIAAEGEAPEDVPACSAVARFACISDRSCVRGQGRRAPATSINAVDRTAAGP